MSLAQAEHRASAKVVVVFGASGQIGRALLPRLIGVEREVLALSRAESLAHSTDVTWRQARLPDSVADLPASDAVISLGPLDLFVEWLRRQSSANTQRVIAISSMSAVSKRESPLAVEQALAARLLAAERALIEHCGKLGLGWTLFRPSMIYGGGTDRTVAALMAFAQAWRVMPIPRARGLRQPVHVEDLAAAVLAATGRQPSADQCFEIGGGERLPVQAMFVRMRAGIRAATVAVPIPRRLIQLASHLASRSSLAARISRLEHDLTADNTDLQAVLGVHPRAFAPQTP